MSWAVEVRRFVGVLVAGGSFCLLAPTARANTVSIGPTRDNTLYEAVDGSVSNGAGARLFAGETATGSRHRALLAFDIAGSIPPGSTITGASLKLNMSRTISGQLRQNLHRVTRSWGEGASNADSNEGQGAQALPDDATWLHAVSPHRFWTTPGGDFASTPSATIEVNGVGSYTWSSAAMASDVQGWLDSPCTNYGWILIGDEGSGATSKRYDSRENTNPAVRPLLTIDFTPGLSVIQASGHVPDGLSAPGTQLTVEKSDVTSDITVAWGSSCLCTDANYEIYEGVMGNPTSFVSIFCSTKGVTQRTFAAQAGNRTYLVVPRSTNREGSYGVDSDLNERLPGAGACLPQLLGPCP